MPSLFKALLLAIVTRDSKELIRYIHFLKTENEIYRSRLPKRITVTPAQRRKLVRAAGGDVPRVVRGSGRGLCCGSGTGRALTKVPSQNERSATEVVADTKSKL